MQSALDALITDASAKEATYTADSASVLSIQANIQATTDGATTAIAAATAPLAPAQALVTSDAAAFNASLDALAAGAIAAKVTNS